MRGEKLMLSKSLQASVDEGMLSEAEAHGLAAAHARNPRGAGRKPREGGTVPTNLRLTPRERDVLAAIGGGDMTAGLRSLLKHSSLMGVLCNA